MRVIEIIAYTLLFIGACAIPGAIEFNEWLAPIICLVAGALLKALTTLYYYER